MFVYLEPRLNAETTSCAGVCHSRVIGSKPQDVSETASGLPPFDHRQLDCFSVVCSSCSRRCSWLAMQVISAQQINRIEFDHTKRVMCTFEPGTYRSYEIHCLCCMHAEDDGPPTLRNDERLAEMMYLVVLTVCHSKTRQAPRLYRLPLPVAVLPVSLTHLPCIDSPNVAQRALSNGYTNSYQLSLTSSGYARHTRSPAIQVACSRRRTRRVLERRRSGVSPLTMVCVCVRS